VSTLYKEIDSLKYINRIPHYRLLDIVGTWPHMSDFCSADVLWIWVLRCCLLVIEYVYTI